MYANEYTHQPVYLQVHTALPLSRSLLYFAPDLVPRMCLYLGRCARVLYMNMLYILTYLVVRMRARVRSLSNTVCPHLLANVLIAHASSYLSASPLFGSYVFS